VVVEEDPFPIKKFLQEFKTYSKDISSLPIPLSHPVNQSGAGTKSLPFKEFF
jgi:hypothetical protein